MQATVQQKARWICLPEQLHVTLDRKYGVNAIGPTNTVTPMMENLIKEHPEILHLGDDKPLQRIGRVEDCMGPAVFLASHASDFMTGQIVYADGGMTRSDKANLENISVVFIHSFT